MEADYQNKNLKKEYLQSHGPQLPECQNELSQEDKEKLFKEIYSNMRLFEKMLDEARQGCKSNSKK